MFWTDLTSPALGALQDGEGPAAVGLVPVGATEQHGPHLPTGTDTVIATELCRLAGERTGAPVLPPVAVGASYGHGTELPGTLSLSPRLLASVLEEYADWAAHSGVRRLLFVNAHANNAAAIGIATDTLRLQRPDLRSAGFEWWQLDPRATAEMLADGPDVHANRAETAMMLAIAPHLVDTEAMATADDEDRTGDLVFRYTASALSRNGVTGRPSEATAELGHRLLGWVLDALVDRVRRGAVETAPLIPGGVGRR